MSLSRSLSPLSALALAFFVTAVTGCVSMFPPHSLDMGRGAAPMKAGDLQVRAGAGGGYAPFAFAVGAGGGVGIEGQVTPDFAVGVDAGVGVQGSPIGVVTPTGTYLTMQYNPGGWEGVAVRGAAGMGVDYIPLADVVGADQHVAPWAAATGGIVASTLIGGLEPYLAMNIGARRFVGGPDSPLIALSKDSGLTETIFAAGGTLGLRFAMSDSLAIYGAGNFTGLLFTPEGAIGQIVPLLSPTGNAQIGVSFTFDAMGN